MKTTKSFAEFLKNISLLAFSILFALVCAEAGLRLVHTENKTAPDSDKTDWAVVPERIWTKYHPVLGWFQQKNKRTLLESSFFKDVRISTNSWGFRGTKEYSEKIRPGSRRGIFLGDSFVFGFGVNDEECFPAVIEEELENFEAINLGIPGYGFDQIYLSYKEIGSKFEADYVFIGIFPDDFWRATRSFADSGHAKPYFVMQSDNSLVLKNVPVPPQFSLKRNQFPDIMRESPFEAFLQQTFTYRLIKKALTQLAKNTRLIDPDTTLEWKLGKILLRQLIAEIKELDAHPVLVLLPPESWAKTARRTSLRKSIKRFSDDTGVDLIDLTEVLNDAIQHSQLTDYYIEEDWHWTAAGNRLAALTIIDYIKKHESV